MNRSRFLSVLLLPCLALGLGCFSTGKTESNSRRAPEVHTGAGASIIWPGQAPAMQYPTGQAAAPPSGGYPAPQGQQAPYGQPGHPAPAPQGQPQSAAPPSSGSEGGGGFTYLGGAGQEEEQNRVTEQNAVGTPDIFLLNVIMAPFAAAAAAIAKPFIHDKDGREAAAQAVPVPTGETPQQLQARSADPHIAHERSQLDAMERELASRGAAPAPEAAPAPPQSRPRATTAPRSESATSGMRRSATGGLSIADELAALRGGNTAPQPAPAPVAPTPEAGLPLSAPPAPSQALPPGAADQVSDRNRDGRPDYWATRASGQLVKEVFDDNGDGRPDKVVHYDAATGTEKTAQEDTNGDGRMDSWLEYAGGQMSRHRRDTDFDGHLDTWSFYRDGQLARQEQDTTGDGFRNRLAFYDTGRLVREQIDRDGDGRVESVTLYDANERPRQRDEDRDGDGLIDTRSIYENGRLARREFVSDEMLQQPIEGQGLSTPAWESR